MRETTDDREFDSRFDAAFQPGFDDSFDAGFTEVARDAGLAVRGSGAGADAGASAGGAARRPRPLVDRFVIVLWAVGAGLIVVGVLGLSSAILAYSSSAYGPTPDYVIGILFSQLAPFLIAIGLATLIGTLFLLATRWEHRP